MELAVSLATDEVLSKVLFFGNVLKNGWWHFALYQQ
jgi:hypothetical protein